MPVPPHTSDVAQIETRLLIVAEMLENAVAEVRRAMADIRDHPDVEPHPPREAGPEDPRSVHE